MLFLFFKSDDFKGTYALLSKSVDKNPAKYERGVKKHSLYSIQGAKFKKKKRERNKQFNAILRGSHLAVPTFQNDALEFFSF